MGAQARFEFAAEAVESIEARYPAAIAPNLPLERRKFTQALTRCTNATFELPNMLVRPRLQTLEGAAKLSRPLHPSLLREVVGVAHDPRHDVTTGARPLLLSGALDDAQPYSRGRTGLDGESGLSSIMTETMRHRALTMSPMRSGSDGRPLTAGALLLPPSTVPAAASRSASGATLQFRQPQVLASKPGGPSFGVTSHNASFSMSGTFAAFLNDTPQTQQQQQQLQQVPPQPSVGEVLSELGQLPAWAEQQLELHPHQVAARSAGGPSALGMAPQPQPDTARTRCVLRVLMSCGGVVLWSALVQCVRVGSTHVDDLLWMAVGGFCAGWAGSVLSCWNSDTSAGGVDLETMDDFRNVEARQRWEPALDVVTMVEREPDRRLSLMSVASALNSKSKQQKSGLWDTLLDKISDKGSVAGLTTRSSTSQVLATARKEQEESATANPSPLNQPQRRGTATDQLGGIAAGPVGSATQPTALPPRSPVQGSRSKAVPAARTPPDVAAREAQKCVVV